MIYKYQYSALSVSWASTTAVTIFLLLPLPVLYCRSRLSHHWSHSVCVLFFTAVALLPLSSSLPSSSVLSHRIPFFVVTMLKCQSCGRKFETTDTLRSHITRVHNIQGRHINATSLSSDLAHRLNTSLQYLSNMDDDDTNCGIPNILFTSDTVCYYAYRFYSDFNDVI